MKAGTSLGIALVAALVVGCGAEGSDSPSGGPSSAASSTAAVQQVSTKTICDLLFREDGVLVKSVDLMGKQQVSAASPRQARRYAREADRIGAHARAGMAAKVDALSDSLRDFARWAESPSAGFSGDAFAVAGLELGNTCGLDLPGANQGSAVPAPGDQAPAQGDTRRLTFFDVSVNSHLHGEGFWAVNLTVCYVRPHPEANSDGTTRVSPDPWSVLIEQSNGSLEQVPVSTAEKATSGLGPQYGEELLRLGQCQTGWVTLRPLGSGRFAGIKYAPRDFPNDTATWQW